MSDIIGCVETLQAKLEKHRNTDLKETPTRNIFIDPLLQALGWDVSDWDKVQTEYPTIDGKSVDYACKSNNTPILLIEAKQLNDPLTDVKAITQIVGYAANAGIEWSILTNGIKYKVYCTREKGAAPDKLLFEVSIDPRDNNHITNQEIVEYLSRFSENSLADGILDKLGEELFTKSHIRKALNKIFQDPPDALIKQVRSTIDDDKIKPAQIKILINQVWNEKLPISSASPNNANIGPKSTATVLGKDPWDIDGKAWHLNRCSTVTREILIKLEAILKNNFQVDGPKWNQKYYVAYRIGTHNWLAISTHPTTLLLRIYVKPGNFRADDIAKQLGIVQFTQAGSLSEKLGLPTSVNLEHKNKITDRITIRLKEDFNLDSPAFLKFLEQCRKVYSK